MFHDKCPTLLISVIWFCTDALRFCCCFLPHKLKSQCWSKERSLQIIMVPPPRHSYWAAFTPSFHWVGEKPHSMCMYNALDTLQTTDSWPVLLHKLPLAKGFKISFRNWTLLGFIRFAMIVICAFQKENCWKSFPKAQINICLRDVHTLATRLLKLFVLYIHRSLIKLRVGTVLK